MLYISRRVRVDNPRYFNTSYGVVDTDDNTETVTNIDFILDAFDSGVKIAGVDRHLAYVAPYQLPQFVTSAQVKLKAVLGMEVTTWGSMITNICYEPISAVPKLRLSDFGAECADFIIFELPYMPSPLTLVFDDKLKSITSWSFRVDALYRPPTVEVADYGEWLNENVRFDIRELSKMSIVESLYEQLSHYLDKSFSFIIDGYERKSRMQAKYA